MSRAERAAKLGRALSHPVRVQILQQLSQQETISPNALAKGLKEPLGNVSYHVTILKDLGAVKLTGTEPRRGAVEHYYGLSATGRALVGVIETL